MLRLLRFFPRRWWSLNAWRSWTAYVHWRLETYGVFDATGKTSTKALKSLIQQFPSYYKWLGQIGRGRK